MPTPLSAAVRVEGMNEFVRAVRAADKRFGRELRVGLNAAAKVVAGEAKPTVPQRTGRLARSVAARSTPREGRVVMGSNSVPYAGFIEFGGRVGINKSVSRPIVREGRFLYPAYVSRRLEVEAIAVKVIGDTARTAGL